MKDKNNFMGIIIPVVVAVILLTVLPIINSINKECPPCEECPSYNIGNVEVNPDFTNGDYIVDKDDYDYLDNVTIIKDENLIPENIKKDVNIYGVVGTYEGDISGGYDVTVINDGGGNDISMLVKFSDGKGLLVKFPYSLPSTNYDDINLKNVVWLKVLSFGVTWASSTGITEAQATNSAGYTLTENVTIVLRD